jgi:RNA polymerase sigma-70 factor, ECF subfamily
MLARARANRPTRENLGKPGRRGRPVRYQGDGPLIVTGDALKLGGMSTARDASTTDEELAEVVARRGRPGGSMAPADRAFQSLYDRHAGPLLAFLATRVRRADLDDLHQDIWRRAWEHLPGSFTGGQFRAWLFRIAHNALIDHGRKRRPEPLGDNHTLADHRHEPPEARLIEEERMTILRRCLDRLEPQSAALVRARLGGEDYVVVCQRLGITPAQAHKRLHAAKAQLKTCVERARP